MDFELNDEQVMLRDTVRDLPTKTYDIETLRAVTDTERAGTPRCGRRSPRSASSASPSTRKTAAWAPARSS